MDTVYMVPIKSLDQLLYLITAQLRDVQTLHSEVISPESLRMTVKKIQSRVAMEGIGFLTKQLPRLGKALDLALSGSTRISAIELGFKPLPDSQLPLLLGELFKRVFTNDGWILPDPCVSSIKSLRQILYSFYKYELPYDKETEGAVLSKFERTEEDIAPFNETFELIAQELDSHNFEERHGKCRSDTYRRITPVVSRKVIARARRLLYSLFKHFDPSDVVPRHGPGAVATREQLWEKWRWKRVSSRILETYPLDAYFYASLNHCMERFADMQRVEVGEDSARVVLVPKDSRGPRLISCEPNVFQFVQQGLGRAIMKLCERHPLTRDNVHFTDQGPNQRGALLGSLDGRYATLDLNEASDRVTVGLVKLLFPGNVINALLNCRSLSTELPGGRKLTLRKYAPMGSALCFPTLALATWSLLTAAAPDADARESILVYGDDVIVPSGYAANAIEVLESFGLKVNRDKSFITGFFRESCGVDAYRGRNVTPVRFHTVWSSSRCPEVLAGWTETANWFYKRSFFYTYELIAGWLFHVYGRIPNEAEADKACPFLIEVPDKFRVRRRPCWPLQRSQYECWTVVPRVISKEIDGWSMLFRYFTYKHGHSDKELSTEERLASFCSGLSPLDTTSWVGRGRPDKWRFDLDFPSFDQPLSVCSYTRPRDTKLVKRWLPEWKLKPSKL